MISELLYIGIGISLVIFAGSLRQSQNQRPGSLLYWGAFFLLGITTIAASKYQYLFILLLPSIIRINTNYWFGAEVNMKRLGGIIVPFGVMVILVEYTSIGSWLLGLFLLSEIFLNVRLIHKHFVSKGISLFSRVGSKVRWILIFYCLNLSLVIFIYLNMTDWFDYIPEAFSVNYILVSVLGIFKYAGNPDSYKPLVQELKYAKSTLDEREKYRILKEIDRQLNEEKYHLDASASLAGLAKRVRANTHQVSQVINEAKGSSFFELMASCRVRDARKILRDPQYRHYKIERIAEEVGYLSKSAFNTSFKKITGFTPSEYRQGDVRDHKDERLDHREITGNMPTESTFGYIKNLLIMLSNFFKIYFRSLLRNKAFSFINLFGLTVGLTSSLLIFVFLRHELSYDKFHERAGDIYRIAWYSGNPQTRTPHPLAQALAKDFTQVESAVTLSPIYGPGLTLQSIYVRNPETNVMFREPDGFLVDSTFFDVFDFELIIGNEKEALSGVGNIVITRTLAEKYFGEENPLGKRMEAVEYDFSGVITGVMEDPPPNSHFHPKFMVSYMTRKSTEPDNPWFQWGDFGHFNYVKLREGTDPREIEDVIPDWLTNYVDLSEDDLLELKLRRSYFALQSITDIHLHSNIRWELEANSNIVYIYILASAIFIILAIASINFINLSTARALERTKEVGIRRTLGAQKAGISFQFLTEAIATCFIALIIAYGLAILIFPQFVSLTGKPMAIQELLNLATIGFTLLMTFSIGVITGIYPALAVTKIKPADILKGKFSSQSRGSVFQKGLIAVQFIFSTVMIFGSAVVLDQIEYMEGKELGFDGEQTLVLELHTPDEIARLEAIKSEITKIPGVLKVGGISNLPGGQFNQNVIFPKGYPDDPIDCSELRVDFDALQVLGLELEQGRWFDRSMSQDSAGASYIVNNAAIESLNLENIYETKIMWNEERAVREGNIVGVLKDFHYKSLHESIQPVVINVNPSSVNYVLVKFDGQNSPRVIQAIADVHGQFDAEFGLDFFFLDSRIDALYNAERKAFAIFNLFTFIAIALAALGLLGLAYLIITQRTREIGIRKVMGARVSDILWMENKSFLKVITISLVIGLPVSYILMQRWMEAFAYRAPFSVMPFMMTVSILAVVAVASVTFAVLRTLLKNPSVALRYE